MYSNSLLPLAVLTACVSFMGAANAETFGNFEYVLNGATVIITGHANVATPNLVVPAVIDGMPVREITSLGFGATLRNSVTTVTIPEGVTTIGATFTNYFALTSVTIPNSATSIPPRMFFNCSALTTATLGNGVTALDTTFMNCSALTTVDLPDNLVSLTNTFTNCSSLAQIQIPDSVTTINGAFTGCTSLTSVVLPSATTSLGQDAFEGCTSLQSVIFPSGLVSIGVDAFSRCSSLASADLPSSLKTIGAAAFYECTSLASVQLPSGLTSIGYSAFDGCSSLTSLTVPESVAVIDDNAFWRCPSLTDIHLPAKFLSSLASIGLDYKPELSTNLLVDGLADRLTSSPAFISALADAIIAKNGHYGLATQANITDVVNDTPQAVRDVLAEIGIEAPVATGITSDLGVLTVKKGKPLAYTVTTSFSSSAFFATGLPDGVTINASTGAISGKPKKPGTYMVLLQAGNPGGGTVGAVKTITVTP